MARRIWKILLIQRLLAVPRRERPLLASHRIRPSPICPPLSAAPEKVSPRPDHSFRGKFQIVFPRRRIIDHLHFDVRLVGVEKLLSNLAVESTLAGGAEGLSRKVGLQRDL